MRSRWLEPEHRSGTGFLVCLLGMGSVASRPKSCEKDGPQLAEESEIYISGFAKGLFTPVYEECCA
jgi:hypothetical protein